MAFKLRFDLQLACVPTSSIDQLLYHCFTSNDRVTPWKFHSFRPMQITDISSIYTPMEEFRIVLSDGKHLQDAVLATGLNDKVRNNLAVRGSIVFLYEYNLLETVENRR